jgi:hypothetical protein
VIEASLRLARAEGHHRIAPEGVVVVEVLAAHRHAEDAPGQQLGHGVLDEFRRTAVGEAAGQLADETGARLGLAKEEHAAASAVAVALEISLDFEAAEVLKSEGLLDTVRVAAVGILCADRRFNANALQRRPNCPHGHD